MSSERSDDLFASYLEGSRRFDYFMVGTAVALVGYLGSRFIAVKIGWNASTIELGSLVALLLSAVCGIKRLESTIQVTALNSRMLREKEAAGSLTDVGLRSTAGINKSTGEVMSAGQMLQKAEYHKVGAEALSELTEEEARRAARWYRSRDFFLVLGLALTILARVAQAYFE